MEEPRVTKRERKLHICYELPHRIHSAQIYPVTAPNGSTVILYGHDRGLRILWRGGRRRKEDAQSARRPRRNGTASGGDVIVIDSDDEEPKQVTQSQQDDFKADEDEQDPDCPYQGVIQAVDLDLDTEVLHLAIPLLPNAALSQTTNALRSQAVVAVACADGSQRVLNFSLVPPNKATERVFAKHALETQTEFPTAGSLCRAIAAKIVASEAIDQSEESRASSFLLVAAVSDKLHIYRFSIFDTLTTLSQSAETQVVPLPHLATGLSFHPSQSSTQLLITDTSGAVRIYDPYASPTSSGRPSSVGSALENSTSDALGRWVIAFHTSFASGKAGLAVRKHILDTKWVMNGKAILTLLEDGEWGIWDLSGSTETGKNIEAFVLNGFLGASSVSESAEPVKQRRVMSKLAPMTPNTRKAKAEVLFSGPPKVPGVAAKGGISISASNSRTGQTDASVLMWYNSEIYSIPSLQAFWQRSTNTSGGFGSLYAPGLTHITDITLRNEAITSISQFSASTANTSFGQMNTQRDLLVSAEHRFIILQALRPATPAKTLFQQAVERPTSRDQKMLDAGELDLGGMDRMLDNMANGNAKPRKVGFAH